MRDGGDEQEEVLHPNRENRTEEEYVEEEFSLLLSLPKVPTESLLELVATAGIFILILGSNEVNESNLN